MIRLLLPLLLLPALAGCDIMGCGNEVLQVVPAPDGRHTTFVYRRDCGATTGFSTQVSVARGTRPLPGDPDPVLVLGDEPVFVAWRGPGQLLVTYRRGL